MDITELVRHWQAGDSQRQIATQTGIDSFALAFPCIKNAGGGPMIGEWGFHIQTDYGETVQHDVYTKAYEALQSKSFTRGVNFWNLYLRE